MDAVMVPMAGIGGGRIGSDGNQTNRGVVSSSSVAPSLERFASRRRPLLPLAGTSMVAATEAGAPFATSAASACSTRRLHSWGRRRREDTAHGPLCRGSRLQPERGDERRARTASTKLRRVHFNAFIMECHRRLHAHSLAVAHELKKESRRAAAVAAEAAAEDVVAGDGILKRPAPEGVDHETGVGAARFRASPPSLSSLETSRPWDAVAELVRKLVAEPGAPETGTNLDQALDRISQSILESTQDGGAHPAAAAAASAASAAADTATDSESDARVETDPHGRPVSAGVLCFDEVQMMDIADATIVSGVLSRLFDAGWVLVATCNRTPDEFARSTMHREHPQARFTARILECCESVHLRTPVDEASGEAIDYRQTLRACLDEPTYISPLGPTTEQTLDGRFADALSGERPVKRRCPSARGGRYGCSPPTPTASRARRLLSSARRHWERPTTLHSRNASTHSFSPMCRSSRSSIVIRRADSSHSLTSCTITGRSWWPRRQYRCRFFSTASRAPARRPP